jgi:hypothetical protein
MIKSRASQPAKSRPLTGPALLACALLYASLAACSHLSETPSHSALIAGEWTLDPANSDDFDATLKQAIEAQDKKLRKRMRPISVGDHDVPPLGMLPPEDTEVVRERLSEQLRPADMLKLQWLEGTLQISANGEPARSFSPGHTASVIDVAGDAKITAGWDGDQFELKTRYEGGEQRSLTYSLDRASGRLVVTLEIKSEAVNKLIETSRYRRVN